MTREDEAIRALCKVTGTYEEVFNSPIVNDLLFPVHEIVAAMVAYGQQRADAEAAAMRERAAGHMRKRAEELREKSTNVSTGAMMYAIFVEEADKIAALPATGEVGRG